MQRSVLAPASRSSRTTSTWPPQHAVRRAVEPLPSVESLSALASRSKRTTFVRPNMHAELSGGGERPPRLAAVGAASQHPRTTTTRGRSETFYNFNVLRKFLGAPPQLQPVFVHLGACDDQAGLAVHVRGLTSEFRLTSMWCHPGNLSTSKYRSGKLDRSNSFSSATCSSSVSVNCLRFSAVGCVSKRSRPAFMQLCMPCLPKNHQPGLPPPPNAPFCGVPSSRDTYRQER